VGRAVGPPEVPDPVRTRLGFAALLIGAVAVRAFAATQFHVVFNDGPIFLAMAEALGDGRFDEVLAHPFHPLYPMAIAAVAAVTGAGLEASAIAVSIVGGAMTVLGVTLAARQAFDPLVGWCVGITVALHPWAVDFSSDVMSDGLYAGFYALGFAALVALIERPSAARGAIVGVCSALAYLVRPEGVGLALVAAVLILLRALSDERARARSLAAALALAVVCVALMAPLLLSLAEDDGELRLTRKKGVAALIEGEAGGRVDEARFAAPEVTVPLPWASVRVGGAGPSRPTRDVAGGFDAVSRAFRTALASFRYEVAVFACLGLWGLRGRADRVREATYALPALAYVGVLVLLVWGAGYVARRHALAPLLPLTAYAVLGWQRFHAAAVARFAGTGPVRAGPRALVIGLVIALGVVWGARDLRERRADRVPVRAAAEWLATRMGEGQRVAAQKLRVAYYARGRFVPLPSGMDEPIRNSLQREAADWVVIDEERMRQHTGLAEGVGDWLEVAHVETGGGRRVFVLEVN